MKFDTKDLVKAITPHTEISGVQNCSFRAYFSQDKREVRIGYGCFHLPKNETERYLSSLIKGNDSEVKVHIAGLEKVRKDKSKTICLTQDILVDPIQEVKIALMKVRPCLRCGGARFENRIKKEKLDGKIKSW